MTASYVYPCFIIENIIFEISDSRLFKKNFHSKIITHTVYTLYRENFSLAWPDRFFPFFFVVAIWMNASISCVTRHLHLVNTSLFAIFTNQHLQNLESSQNQTAIGVTPDPFFRHHKEKRKKAAGHARLRKLNLLLLGQALH